jgi:hypothetical protein
MKFDVYGCIDGFDAYIVSSVKNGYPQFQPPKNNGGKQKN